LTWKISFLAKLVHEYWFEGDVCTNVGFGNGNKREINDTLDLGSELGGFACNIIREDKFNKFNMMHLSIHPHYIFNTLSKM
jgi:hypothetical protein